MQHIKCTVDVRLVFEEDVGGKQECIGYVDSDYVGDFDKRWSATGYVFTLSQAPVSLHCTLHSTMALSMTKVEYMALDRGCKGSNLASGLDG